MNSNFFGASHNKVTVPNGLIGLPQYENNVDLVGFKAFTEPNFKYISSGIVLQVAAVSSMVGADRSGFSGQRRAAQGRRIIKNSGRRIIKNSGRRIVINIRHNYMHDVTRSKSGGVRRSNDVTHH